MSDFFCKHSETTTPLYHCWENTQSAAATRRWPCAPTGRRNCGAATRSWASATSVFTACLATTSAHWCEHNGKLALFILQRRPDLRLPALHRDEAVRRAELHARRTGLRARTPSSHYRANVTPPKDYKRVGRAGAPACRPLGRTLWPGRSAAVVLRGLERAEPASFLDRHAGGLFRALRCKPPSDQGGGRRAAGRRPGHSGATPGSTSSSTFCAQQTCRPISSARITTRPMRCGARLTTPRRN